MLRYWRLFRVWLDARGWGRRARSDALAILTLALAAYLVASRYDAFDSIYEFAHARADYGVDDMLVVALIVGLAMTVYCMRRMNELARAMADRRRAEAERRTDGERAQHALDHMIQGVCLFGADSRLLLWNRRYQAMYRIDPKRIWAGCSVRDLLDARIAAGTFPLDPGDYESDLRTHLAAGETFLLNIELEDGRTIEVVNVPLPGGSWMATHEDITERKRAERERDRTRMFLDKIINSVPSNIVVKEVPSRRYLLVNGSGEKYFGLPRGTMIGKTTSDVFSEAAARAIDKSDREAIESGKEMVSDEHSVITPDGVSRIVMTRRIPVRDDDGKLQFLISVIDDLTERKRDEQRIAHMKHHDPQTDLPNRTAFNECIAATHRLASSTNDSFALLSIDLDRFKEVNDVYGISCGDAVIRQAAARLQAACEGAFIARSGGDEFMAISPCGPQPATAEALAERLTKALQHDIQVGSTTVRVGITIGVGIFPQDGPDPGALIANANAALHRAKAEERGTIRFFEMAMDRDLREKRALQQDLRQALLRDEFVVHYQPYATIGGEPLGFEALVRWNHPVRGMVPPAHFISLAEHSGLIVPLGEWVLREACREAALWPKPLCIGVNLSPVQFRQANFVETVHEILLETGLAPARLKLEVTEGLLIDDFARGMSVLRRLKNLGIRIAMDDFGSGYSSLSYLQSFPFDKIKIDRCFVANLPQNEQSAAIVRAVIGLAHGLGLPVVAEGVETQEQLTFLAAAQCDEIQGYLIGRPKPIADYAELVGRVPFGRKRRARTTFFAAG